jgi:hypothetical protein
MSMSPFSVHRLGRKRLPRSRTRERRQRTHGQLHDRRPDGLQAGQGRPRL